MSLPWLLYSAQSRFDKLPTHKQQAVIWIRERLPALVRAGKCGIVRNDCLPVEYKFDWAATRLQLRFCLSANDEAMIFDIVQTV